MSRLFAIAAKDPIVPTFRARALRDTPAEVRDIYAWHASTYVEQPALADLRRSFVDAVLRAQTPKACLIAPFGYGKTASVIGLWNACSQGGLLVIPPISCCSFTELAGAIYDWLAFALPDLAPSLAEAHDTFLVSSAESLARHDERVFGIPFDQAITAIRDKLQRGYLDFDDVSINLLAFIDQATAIAQLAGYSGLVVMIDEFQQLLGNANKGTLIALRQFIWGLRVRKMSFGFVMTMDPDTERTLSDRAGDILHRIKDDGFYLDIRHIYDHTFPARLWQQYADALGLNPVERQAIDRPALEALGQLCERDDLSNGPRTVINVLQRASERWTAEEQAAYNPINLIDDLLTGRIRFDGDRGIVPALVAELLSFPYFQRSRDRAAALKLIAAFPRGCPEHVAEQYGLGQAWRELNDDLRGEIVTETEEGLALIELRRVGRPANRLNILLRRYWMQITDQQLFAEDAIRVFRDIVLALLFPKKVNDLNGWSGVADVQLTADNTYAGIIEGAASPAFPLRRIAVSVRSPATQELIEPVNDIDLQIIFAIDVRPAATSSVTVMPDLSQVVCSLAVGRVAEHGLRGSIAWIAHYLSPHPISPAVVLSLLHYLNRERLDTLPQRDRARIEDTLSRLREWLLSALFPSNLFASAGFPVVSTGASALKEFLFQIFTRRWPTYQALARFPNWTALLRDYQHALSKVAPAAKIGQEPVIGSKITIAELFGQKRHAGFDSYARQYGALLQIETWQGNNAAIRFVPHPMELHIADMIRRQGVCTARIIYLTLRQEGFAAAEAEQIITLALARGLIRREDDQITVPIAPTAIELATRLQALRQRAQTLDIPEQLSALLVDFDPSVEHAATAAWRLDQAERYIVQREEQVLAATRSRRNDLRDRIKRHMPQLGQELPEPPAGIVFKQLTAVRKELAQTCHALKGPALTFVTNPDPALPLSMIETLATQVETLARQMQWYIRWVVFARDFAHLHEALSRIESDGSRLASLRRQCDQLKRQARSVLAEIGMKGLAEIDHVQTTLADLNRQFTAMADERQAAYESAAIRLRDDIVNLLNMSATFPIPAYRPDDDAQSYRALKRSIATVVNCALALLEASLSDDQNGAAPKNKGAARLRKRVRAMAARTRDPDKLFAEASLSLRPDLIEQIRKLRNEAAAYQQTNTAVIPTRSRLIAALSDVLSGPADISSILAKMNGAISRDELLRELLQLHEHGVVRLVIDLPEHGNA
jgi:hypothetical protein